jgi:hypothetical protein
MSKKYAVTVRETHTYVITVEAEDVEGAIEKAEADLLKDEASGNYRQPDHILSDHEDWEVEEITHQDPSPDQLDVPKLAADLNAVGLNVIIID